MKNKRSIKGVAIIMSLLSILSLGGCAANTPKQREEDNEKAVEFLNKKYNKEFKISESIHEVNSASGGVARLRQGYAYCVDNPDETFFVYVDNNNDEVYGDKYQNITMRAYAQEYYEKIMEKNWSECLVLVSLTCRETKDEVYSKENYETFLTNEDGSASVMVFIQSSNDNTEKEAENIYLFSERLKEMGLKGVYSYVYTIDKSTIDIEKMKDINKSIQDYIKAGIVVRECAVIINKTNTLNIEDIKKDLNKN